METKNIKSEIGKWSMVEEVALEMSDWGDVVKARKEIRKLERQLKGVTA